MAAGNETCTNWCLLRSWLRDTSDASQPSDKQTIYVTTEAAAKFLLLVLAVRLQDGGLSVPAGRSAALAVHGRRAEHRDAETLTVNRER
ncbi:hypothetical protein NDU88_001569 [Pleurodeles waltl]|uniref:Uncharacterized protein n=1 Tax=Pleurodeles waltl TaxID=8319 RepID=A0AAV7KQK2_PLEWA|nr:hypothetical protein NDU88_001569 [Pleurodeles waltl]